MARRTVDMTGLTTKPFLMNHRRDADYNATIQNLSGQSLTVTVTNQDAQKTGSLTYDVPASGALVIANGAIGQIISEPYEAALFTLGGAGSGPIEIVEAG
jgi:hypothetical protein